MAMVGESSSSMAAAERPPGFEVKQFPAGMRVVAVDDDQICLAMLHKLLRKCDYKVSCFSNAVEALKMIRQNKDEIDIVITDVHMPEIDGFKLLEIAGLELDLPVIMLSANDTRETVMKGVMHGACDYLIKPVRFEELSVIWKHVVRRQKSIEDFEEAMNFNNMTIGDDNAPAEDNAHEEDNAQAGRRVTRSGNRTRANTGKRRKEDSDEEDDSEEMEDDERFTKKKPRVVWSPDLHRKFVNAVSEIGVDKAVPKSILEKMNVERLTRENVASHLQKYRLYLKRLNSNPQAIQAAFGTRSPLSIDLRSFERFKNFHAHGRYRPPVSSNPSRYQTSRFNITSGSSPSPSSVMANLNPSQSTQFTGTGTGTGFNIAGTSNFTLANNIMNGNQMNMYNGVGDMSSSFVSTSNGSYWNNNGTSFMSMSNPTPASEPLPIAPFGYRMNNSPGHTASLMGPHFGGPANLIGGIRNSVSVDRLQQVVSSLNNSLGMPDPNVTSGMNNGTCDVGLFYNNPVNLPPAMSGGMMTGVETVGMGTGITNGIGIGITGGGVGTNVASGGMGTSGIVSGNIGTGMTGGGIGVGMTNGGVESGTANGVLETNTVNDGLETGTINGVGQFDMSSFDAASGVAGTDVPSSSSFQGGNNDDIPIGGIEELLASLLKPGGGVDSMSFMDDDFFNN